MHQYIWYLLISTAVLGLVALIVPTDKGKKIASMVTLGSASLVVLLFLGTIMSGSGRVMKSSASMPADKAELQLRLTYAVQVGMQDMVSRMKVSDAEKAKFLGDSQNVTQSFDLAESGLAEAIARGDESPVTKAKVATLLYLKEIHHPTATAPARNPSMFHAGTKPKAQLPDTLRDPQAITSELEQDKDPKIQALGRALHQLFSKDNIPHQQVDTLASAIEDGLPFGWYRDGLLRLLNARSGGNDKLHELISERDNVYLRTFLGAIMVMVTALLATVIGAVVILIELALMARKKQQELETAALNVPLLEVYKVFIAWFCTQAAISVGLQQLIKTGSFKLPPDPFNMAIVTAITYLIANVPGLIYIYLFALRPRGLKFWPSLKVRTKTATMGPIKLILCGFLGWCAAFPLVLLMALVASLLTGSQGSENPVISQIMSAANAPNPIVILLFYLTIAVMAPICEETMFRGFIYGALRPRLGAALAVLVSAMIFGLVHFDKGGILGLIAIGIVLAYLFERTKSLLPCMITHGLWNGAMFTATLILFGTR